MMVLFFTTWQIKGSLNTSGQIADAQKTAQIQSLGQLLEKAEFLSIIKAAFWEKCGHEAQNGL